MLLSSKKCNINVIKREKSNIKFFCTKSNIPAWTRWRGNVSTVRNNPPIDEGLPINPSLASTQTRW